VAEVASKEEEDTRKGSIRLGGSGHRQAIRSGRLKEPAPIKGSAKHPLVSRLLLVSSRFRELSSKEVTSRVWALRVEEEEDLANTVGEEEILVVEEVEEDGSSSSLRGKEEQQRQGQEVLPAPQSNQGVIFAAVSHMILRRVPSKMRTSLLGQG